MWGLGLSSLRFVGTGVSGSGKHTNLLFAWKSVEASKGEVKVGGRIKISHIHIYIYIYIYGPLNPKP